MEIQGWEELDVDLVRLEQLGLDVSAIGLDLSNYSDADADQWWDKEPVVEFSAYTDDVFPFSTSNRAELLRHTGAHAPWRGAMTGQETAVLEVTGLRPVNGALLRHGSLNSGPSCSRQGPDRDAVAAFPGAWWLHLRFHQVVHRHLEDVGIARRVPVLVGTRDVGPWLQSVYLVGRPSRGYPTAVPSLTARAQATAADIGDARESVRTWGGLGRDRRPKES